jgi:hypothetical protein
MRSLAESPQRARLGVNGNGLPLDPPPFYLEGVVWVGVPRGGAFGFAVGLAILLLVVVLNTTPSGAGGSLGRLMVASIAAAAFYLGARKLIFWVVWLAALRKNQASGAVNPAARGELPRNGYLLVSILPLVAFVIACVAGSRWVTDPGPGMWLAVAVIAGIALRDITAAWRVMFVPPYCWIKEKGSSLDILRPVRSDSRPSS